MAAAARGVAALALGDTIDEETAAFTQSIPPLIVCGCVSIITTLAITVLFLRNKALRKDHASNVLQLITVVDLLYTLKNSMPAFVWVGGYQNLFASLGFIDDNCQFSRVSSQALALASLSWNAVLIFDMFLSIRNPMHNTGGLQRWYHAYVWTIVVVNVIYDLKTPVPPAAPCWVRQPTPLYEGFRDSYMALALVVVLYAAGCIFFTAGTLRRIRLQIALRFGIYVAAFVVLWIWPQVHHAIDPDGRSRVWSVIDAMDMSGQAAVMAIIRLSEPFARRQLWECFTDVFCCFANCCCCCRGDRPPSRGRGSCMREYCCEGPRDSLASLASGRKRRSVRRTVRPPASALAFSSAGSSSGLDGTGVPRDYSGHGTTAERGTIVGGDEREGSELTAAGAATIVAANGIGGGHAGLVGTRGDNSFYAAHRLDFAGDQPRAQPTVALTVRDGVSGIGPERSVGVGSLRTTSVGGGAGRVHSVRIAQRTAKGSDMLLGAQLMSSSSLGDVGTGGDAPISGIAPARSAASSTQSGAGGGTTTWWPLGRAASAAGAGSAGDSGAAQPLLARDVTAPSISGADAGAVDGDGLDATDVLVDGADGSGDVCLTPNKWDLAFALRQELLACLLSGVCQAVVRDDAELAQQQQAGLPPPSFSSLVTTRRMQYVEGRGLRALVADARSRSMSIRPSTAPSAAATVGSPSPVAAPSPAADDDSSDVAASTLGGFRFGTCGAGTFASLRRACGVTCMDVVSALDPALLRRGLLDVEFTEGASSSFFCRSSDSTIFLKTISAAEYATLARILPGYAAHVTAHPSSLLCRFYGAFSLHFPTIATVYCIAMGNIMPLASPRALLPPSLIDYAAIEIYDLKGSTLNRTSRDGRLLLDTDFERRHPLGISIAGEIDDIRSSATGAGGDRVPTAAEGGFGLGPSSAHSVTASMRSLPETRASNLLRQLYLDAEFLRRCGIMDYSLIVNVIPVVPGVQPVSSVLREASGLSALSGSDLGEAMGRPGRLTLVQLPPQLRQYLEDNVLAQHAAARCSPLAVSTCYVRDTAATSSSPGTGAAAADADPRRRGITRMQSLASVHAAHGRPASGSTASGASGSTSRLSKALPPGKVCVLQCGIIDMLQTFTLGKRIEAAWKNNVSGRIGKCCGPAAAAAPRDAPPAVGGASSLDPDRYAARFLAAAGARLAPLQQLL